MSIWPNSKPLELPQGPTSLYHYVRGEGENKKRIHLRVEQDGNGVLVINASQMIHLNISATLMAKLILDEINDVQAIQTIKNKFGISKSRAESDYQSFKESLKHLISPHEDACPICDLNLEVLQPFTQTPSAPYRMDLAITYRCNNQCLHCYNDISRAKMEYSTDAWKLVLEKVWELGIPHVVFTGGEPTLRPDLPELISYAEQLGLVSGLNTNGRRLKDADFVEQLVDAGLDHVQITLESHNAAIHDTIVMAPGAHEQTVTGIRNALATRIFVMTNTTMLQHNAPYLAETLEFLNALQVPTIGLNGLIYSGRGAAVGAGLTENELGNLLSTAKAFTERSGQRLIWYTPTQYCRFNPLDSGLGIKGCTAALYNMCVEPDGSVLPCQSYYESLGNILEDDWDSIWNHELALSIRERKYIPSACHDCELLTTCGGGCPLYLSHQPLQPQAIQALPF